jgi:hypothetical protein
MHSKTHRDIEKQAVMELINYFENEIDDFIDLCAEEHDKRNKMYEIQGLRPKTRIDKETVRKAIKTLNQEHDSSMSEKTGGMIQRKNKNEKHSPREELLTEVT